MFSCADSCCLKRGVFISESDGCIAIRCVVLTGWKASSVLADDISGVLLLENIQDLCLELFVSHLIFLFCAMG